MTPAQIKLVQSGFARVAPNADTAADLFYTRLFEIAPELRSLFPDDLDPQKKKLMAMLGTAVAGLAHLETLLPAVEALGRRHASYGVSPAHYAPVGGALLWTLEQGLGAAFTPEMREAWGAAYTMLARTMIDASGDAPIAA